MDIGKLALVVAAWLLLTGKQGREAARFSDVSITFGRGHGSHSFAQDVRGSIGPVAARFTYTGPATAVTLAILPPPALSSFLGALPAATQVIGDTPQPTSFSIEVPAISWPEGALFPGIHVFVGLLNEVSRSDVGMTPSPSVLRELAAGRHDVTIRSPGRSSAGVVGPSVGGGVIPALGGATDVVGPSVGREFIGELGGTTRGGATSVVQDTFEEGAATSFDAGPTDTVQDTFEEGAATSFDAGSTDTVQDTFEEGAATSFDAGPTDEGESTEGVADDSGRTESVDDVGESLW